MLIAYAMLAYLNFDRDAYSMKRPSDEKEKKGNSIAGGFKRLAITTVAFGIAYVLFFTFCWGGD